MMNWLRLGLGTVLLLFVAACDHSIEEPVLDVGAYHITGVQVKNGDGSKAPRSVIAAIKRGLIRELANSGKDGKAVVLRIWIGGYSSGKTWRKDWLAGGEKITIRGNLLDKAADKSEGAFRFNLETVDKETKLYKAIVKERRNAQKLLNDHLISQAKSRVRLNLP